MSYNVETMGHKHTTVQFAKPDTLIGEDRTKGWALILNGDNVTVIEGFETRDDLAEWLLRRRLDILQGDRHIAEGDDE